MMLQITLDLDKASASQVEAVQSIDYQYAVDVAVINAVSAMTRPDVSQWGVCKNMIGQPCGGWEITE